MPVLHALLAALTFGLSAPLAKALLGQVPPLLTAGLLYLGAGLCLTVARARGPSGGRRWTARDRWVLVGVVMSGGLVAPPLLMWGLANSPASSAALLLNLEAVVTTLLAGAVFGERLGGRVWAAAVLMGLGGMALAWTGGLALSPASLAVIGACVFWSIDNNLTSLISDVDATAVAQVKGLVAGVVNVGLALLMGASFPPTPYVLGSLALGAVGYGLSLVLFILAMRRLGAARATSYFALAPFFGAAGAFVVLREPIGGAVIVAAVAMAGGVALLLSEQHSHVHRHAAGTHTHRHVHDEHHQHGHEGWEGAEPHVHPHPTGPLDHAHPHRPDLHHDHPHP